jgi:hypothetical protein
VTRGLPAGTGPYVVELTLKSNSRGNGQIFWTTAADKTFHRDRSVPFEPRHDGEQQTLQVKLSVDASLTALRIDPSTAPGEIELQLVRLKNKDGKVLAEWPATKPKSAR